MSNLSFDDVLIKPQYSNVDSRDNVDLSTNLVHGIKLGVPVISANMDTVTEEDMAIAMANNGATGVIHRFMSIHNQKEQVLNAMGRTHGFVGAAVGINIDRAYALMDAGVDYIVVDVAHADNKKVLNFIENISFYSVPIIAGNIATRQAALRLYDCGVSGVKVGIGPGSFCTTRKQTGVGVPQISAISDISSELENRNITICADGGVRTPGDIAKAIAAGADTIMSGSLFVGCDESPEPKQKRSDGKFYKWYRGSASFSCKVENGKSGDYVEGAEGWVPYFGSVKDRIRQISDGLRSSFSYVGARNIEQFRDRAEIIQVGPSTRNVAR